jgi:hypothetical protein
LAKQPRARTLAELQTQLDLFDSVYNTRPHQSLDGATPDQPWQGAPQASLGPPRAARAKITTVTVDSRGAVTIGARYQAGIGRRWTGVRVTVITQGDDVGIFHGNTLIRRLTIDPDRRYQPSGAPRRGVRHQRVLSAGQ